MSIGMGAAVDATLCNWCPCCLQRRGSRQLVDAESMIVDACADGAGDFVGPASNIMDSNCMRSGTVTAASMGSGEAILGAWHVGVVEGGEKSEPKLQAQSAWVNRAEN